jgi:hypothetical protein
VNLQQYLALKDQIEAKKRSRDRLQGRYDTFVQRLKDDFGCVSVAEMVKILAKNKKKLVELESDYQEKLNNFHKEHGDLL